MIVAPLLFLSACIITSNPNSDVETIASFPQAVPIPEVEAAPLQDTTPPLVEIEGQRILGLEPRTTEDIFGTASFVRWDGSAIIRQYKNDLCILDIVFYEEISGDPFRATYFESRSLSGESLELKECLKGFFADGEIPSLLLKEG